MKKHKIFITQPIPETGIKLLKKQKNLTITQNKQDKILTKTQLKQKTKNTHAILSLLTDKIDKEIINNAPNLKIISNYAVGYDNIDIKTAKNKKITITNTPEVLTEAVAEHTVALITSIARRIVESDNYTRQGKYKHWKANLLLGTQLKNKQIGILGLGRIGYRVAEILTKGHQMKATYYDKKRNKKLEKKLNIKYQPLKKLLQTSDFISIHTPLLPTTKHLINTQQLKQMKKTATLINTSRGPIINEKALATALKNKTIKAAAIDVFENEPKITPQLKKLKNIIITPHTASATTEARNKMAEIAAKNIILKLQGKKPLTQI